MKNHVGSTPEKPSSSNELQDLAEAFQKKLPNYIAQIKQVWKYVQTGDWNPKLAKSLQYFCHKLVGSSATYGFKEISECVREIETILIKVQSSPLELNSNAIENIDKQVKKLTSIEINEPDNKLSSVIEVEHSDSKRTQPIFVVDDDEDSGLYLKSLLEKNNFTCHYFDNIKDSIKAVLKEQPSVVLMDINFPEGRLAGIVAINKIRQAAGYRLPVIMHSAHTDFKIRMVSANNGCDGFLSKPVIAEELSVVLNRVLNIDQFHDKRVLIIDDDKSIALYYQAILKKMGIESLHIAEPMQSLKTISDYRPHLILLDNIMPGCTGLELAKLLRQDPKMMSTGIIFITADNDFTLNDKLFSLGVSGFLHKPVKVEQLTSSIREYLINSGRFNDKLEKIIQTSPNLKVANQNYFYSHVEKLLADEVKLYCGLMMIAFDSFESLKKKLGMAKASLVAEKLGAEIAGFISDKEIATLVGDSNFIVFFKDKKLDNIVDKANQLVSHLNSRVDDLSDNKFKFSLKYSLAPTLTNQDSIEVLIDRSEIKLKDSVNQKLAISEEASIKGDSESLSTLDQSIIEKSLQDNRFSLVYQPIFSLGEREKNSFIFDTFVRLVSEDGKSYTPEQFFPYIKEKAFFSKLDHYVIENVIKLLGKLNRSMQNKVCLQARLSDQALTNRDTLLWVSNSLNNMRMLNKDVLTFELSERSLVKNIESAKYFVEKIKLLGCQIAITDFGETTQSMAMIELLHPSVVKLNAKIVLDKKNSIAQEAVNNLLDYATTHKIDIIASKVENANMISELYSKDIPLYQGYFIHRPSDVVDLEIEQSLHT
ncbi:MAG: response regulator [Gammaproteobacteria bacterium]|nr:response regulator [Gammaproteobacteria bacterium]